MTETRIRRISDVVSYRTKSLTVVLDGVHDPHNFSAVLRSSEAFGLLDIHAVVSSGPFSINTLITQGAEKWVNVHRHDAPGPCIEALSKQGFQLWTANPSDTSVQVSELPWDTPLALVFGNENSGVSATMTEASRGSFHIPMYGFSQSLNISVSAAITLATAVKMREKRPQGHGDLTTEEQKDLMAEYQKRSVRGSGRILSRLEAKKNNPKKI